MVLEMEKDGKKIDATWLRNAWTKAGYWRAWSWEVHEDHWDWVILLMAEYKRHEM